MSIEFDLKIAQMVNVDYSIVIVTAAANQYLCTRVKIDGAEDRRFRAITGDTYYHTNSMNKKVWLEKGRHKVQV